MTRLRYIGEGSYRGHGDAWPNGEVREVDEHEEKFIHRHVPSLFETEDGESLAAPAAPKQGEDGGEKKGPKTRTKPAAPKQG